jgi:hypothetical protein
MPWRGLKFLRAYPKKESIMKYTTLLTVAALTFGGIGTVSASDIVYSPGMSRSAIAQHEAYIKTLHKPVRAQEAYAAAPAAPGAEAALGLGALVTIGLLLAL